MGDPLVQPFQIAFENTVSEAGIASAAGRLGEGRPGFGEFIQIALKEKQMAGIERVQVTVEKLPCKLGVEWLVGELRILEDLCSQSGGGGVRRFGIHRIRIEEAKRHRGRNQRRADKY